MICYETHLGFSRLIDSLFLLRRWRVREWCFSHKKKDETWATTARYFPAFTYLLRLNHVWHFLGFHNTFAAGTMAQCSTISHLPKHACLPRGRYIIFLFLVHKKKLLFSLQVSQCLHLILVYFKDLANPGWERFELGSFCFQSLPYLSRTSL